MAGINQECARINPQGFALIITNDYDSHFTPDLEVLKGTKEDGERMREAFVYLNFVTHCEHNISEQRLDQLLQEAAQSTVYPKECKSIVFVFSGHGCQGNLLYMQDGEKVRVELIMERFLPKNARHIGDIPKLFFIDACRGKEALNPVTVPRGGGEQVGEPLFHVPPEGNFLVAYSTMPRYQSYERKGEGGIWMRILADKLRTSQESIDDILTAVNEELMRMYQQPGWPKGSMQQPEKFSRLNKRVYLWPGARNSEGQLPSVTQSAAYAGPTTVLQPVSVHPSLQWVPRPPTQNISRHNGLAIEGGVLPTALQPDMMAVPPQPNPHPYACGENFTTSPIPHGSYYPHQATQLYPSDPNGGIPTANAHLSHHLGQQQATPQYDFIDDSSFGQSRFKCTIKYTTDGHTERVASDGYYPNREDAREEAAAKALTKEVSKSIATRGATPTSSIHKRKLKEYYDEKGQAHEIKYGTKEPPKGGYQSTVFAPGMGYAKGDICGSEKQAENSAAFHALQKLGVIEQ